jgi:hypothetical protein
MYAYVVSPTGKGTDSPCIPRCARRGPFSYAFSGVQGGITGTEQGSTTRRTRGKRFPRVRALRVQGDHLPARRRRLHVCLCHVSDGQGE